jgi:hypothetical protein
LPDDFVHIKSFKNLDSMHNRAVSFDNNFEENENEFPNIKNNSERNMEDVIMSEPISQMLEETPTNIIYNSNVN